MKKAFTLIELVITVIMVAILASISVGPFMNMINKSNADQAIVYLRTIRAAENLYYSNNFTVGYSPNIAADLHVSIAGGSAYNIVITPANPGGYGVGFTATATRISDNITIIYNQSGVWTGTYTPLPPPDN